MAHYAVLGSDLRVIQVFVGRDDVVEGIGDWETYYAPEGCIVKKTSYNTYGGVHYDPETGEPSEDQTKAFRYNFAGIGYTFDADKGTHGAFIAPQVYPSWVLNEDTCLWDAPVSYPEETDADGNPVPYVWDEDAGDWVAVETPGA